MHSKIATGVNPDSVMDVLFSKSVIGTDDCDRIRQVPAVSDRCLSLLSLLHSSSHPQTFIYLRLALLDEHSLIVDEVDKLPTSSSSWLQQLHQRHSADGKLMFIYLCLVLYLFFTSTKAEVMRSRQLVCQSFYKDYYISSQPVPLKLGVMIGHVNQKNWLTFGGNPVLDMDSGSLFYFPHHCRIGDF